jgi:hypothetical protein
MTKAEHRSPKLSKARAAGLFAACLWLAACGPARAQQKPAPPSEEDWRAALDAIRRIALDANETEEHRAGAVTACAKVLLWKNRHDEALKLCREVLKHAARKPVIDAALRAGCLVARNRHGHLRAEIDFLASCAQGAAAHEAASMTREINRTVQTLSSLAGRTMVPSPVVPRLPHWAAAGPRQTPGALHLDLPKIQPPEWYRFQPGKAHPALHVTLPRMEPPSWYGRSTFPLLKEPKKK